MNTKTNKLAEAGKLTSEYEKAQKIIHETALELIRGEGRSSSKVSDLYYGSTHPHATATFVRRFNAAAAEFPILNQHAEVLKNIIALGEKVVALKAGHKADIASRKKASKAAPRFAGKIIPSQIRHNTILVLCNSTAQFRVEYVARYVDMAVNSLVSMREMLAKNGMDLNKVAPWPKSTMSRMDYRVAQAVHEQYRACFMDDSSAPHQGGMAQLSGNAPWIVVERAGAEAKIRQEAAQSAHATFDSFIFKMATKIDVEITSATLTGTLWDGCNLLVVCKGGGIQNWSTKCILNFSVYQKPFDQWPTRRTS